MLCQKCRKNQATVRYTEVVDGHVTEVHLCSACLEEVQNNPKGFKYLNAGFGEETLRSITPPSKEEEKKVKAKQICSVCGTQLSYILESNKVGCFSCYKNFGVEIESLLEKIQGGSKHIGKRPDYPDDDERIQTQILLDAKKALIRQAIKAEDYESAARLRDEIRDLEKTLASWKMGKN